MDKDIKIKIENMPTLQEAWAFINMVRNRDVHGVEEFCKKFTVNEKWLKEIDFLKPSCDITLDQYKMVAKILGLSLFGESLIF